MRNVLSALASSSIILLACTRAPVTGSPAPAAAPAPAPAAAPATQGGAPAMTAEQTAARNDSLMKDRTENVNHVLASIAGREEMPAEQVYKNIKMLKGMPAARLLNIMNRGYSNSLGVSCSHCHVVGEYDREDKLTKQIARDMSAMVTTINGTLLKDIRNLKSPNPTVNCGTCHNGRPRPGAGSAASPAPRPGSP